MEGKVRQENPESPEMMDGEKAHKYIAAMLENLAEDDVCAVFMINLDNTEEIRERFGEQEELAAESRAEQILSSMFIGTDIVSRIGKSEFFVFTLWRAGEKEVAGKAEEICRRLRECGGGSGCPLCASTGAYMAKTQGQTFDSLFGFAAAALYEAKKRGSGSWYVLANETEAKGTAGEEAARPISGLTLNAFLDCLEGGVCLIEAGQELRVVFASSGFYRMTDRLPEQMSVPCGIDELGIHPDYEADYEQALKAAGESGEGFEHIHRIAEDGNRWIWRHVKVQSVPYPASRYPVLLEVSRDISKSVETEKKLCENNERLRIAFRQIPNVLWEVDISARTYNIYDVDAQMCRPETEIGDFPRSFVEKGLVHRDSAENFLGFANRMISGKNAEVGNFIMKDPSGSGYGWVSMSYYMMFDRNGAPEKAVGLQTKLPAISGITPGAFPRRPLPEAVRHHILVRIKANLTADYVDSVWTHGSDRTAWTWGRTYTQVMKNRSVRLFREAERREFDRRFSRENLLEDFRKGRVWTAGEYQSVDDGGSIRWISAAINLQEDPQSGEVYMFACITDSQQRHMWEMGMKNGVFRDPDTGLYDLTTARNMSEYILSRSGNMECAVALIRMIYGEEPGFMERTEDEALRRSRQSIAAALSLALGGDCVIGNYKAGMIYVFFPQAESRFELKKQIEDAFAYVRVTMDGSDEINKLRFVAGVVT